MGDGAGTSGRRRRDECAAGPGVGAPRMRARMMSGKNERDEHTP